MGARSRKTGAAVENRVARLLTATTGTLWRRTTIGRSQAACGDVAPDVWPPASHPSWSESHALVEVKAHAVTTIGHIVSPTKQLRGWWAKARDDAAEYGRAHVLFLRVKGRGLVALGQHEHLREILDCPTPPSWYVSNIAWLAEGDESGTPPEWFQAWDVTTLEVPA